MCECYQIGGPWIAEDPNCPAHGTYAQEETRMREEAAEKTQEYITSLRASLATLERIVSHYGANRTEVGLPHPQQQALDEARRLLAQEIP